MQKILVFLNVITKNYELCLRNYSSYSKQSETNFHLIKNLFDQIFSSLFFFSTNLKLCKRQDELMSLQREKSEKSSYETCIQAELKDKTALIHKLHADLDARNQRLDTQLEKLTQAAQEIAQLKNKCDDQDRALKDYQTRLADKLQGSEAHLASLTGQLVEREDQLVRVGDESARRLAAIEQMEREMAALEARHDTAVKEIGRLESRVQSQQLDFKNDSKIMEIEMQKRDERYC